MAVRVTGGVVKDFFAFWGAERVYSLEGRGGAGYVCM